MHNIFLFSIVCSGMLLCYYYRITHISWKMLTILSLAKWFIWKIWHWYIHRWKYVSSMLRGLKYLECISPTYKVLLSVKEIITCHWYSWFHYILFQVLLHEVQISKHFVNIHCVWDVIQYLILSRFYNYVISRSIVDF